MSEERAGFVIINSRLRNLGIIAIRESSIGVWEIFHAMGSTDGFKSAREAVEFVTGKYPFHLNVSM